MRRHHSYFLRAATTGVLNSIASAIAVALLLPPLISRIGLEAYGFWSILTLFVGLASLLDIGLSKAIVYLTALGHRDPGIVLAAALTVGGALAACVAVGLIVIAVIGVPVFGPAVAAQPNLALWVACCGGLILVCSVITTLLRSVLEAQFRLDIVNIGFAALTLFNFGVALVLATVTSDPRALMLATTATFVVLLFTHIIAVAIIAPVRLKRPSPTDFATLLRAGFGAYVADLPAVLLAPVLQYFFSLQARSASDYGVFDLALRIATLCGTALGSLSSPYFAIVAAATADSRSEVRRSISRHLRITLLMAVGGWLFFLLAGKPLLALLLRQSISDLYPITLTMLAGAALVAALEPVSRMLLGLGRRRAIFVNRTTMLLATIIAAACLTSLAPLERFSIAYAAGFIFAAMGLSLLNYRERWGRP
jgi:O-antigen/teichoic acid export membrane protein